MTQPNNEPTEPNLQSTLTEALRLLEEIRLARVKAEEHLGVAEASRNKADSEALFAFNAKKACEEHSTAIASLKGTVEADVNGIVANKQKSDELMAAINAGKAAIDADQKTINDRRKEVDQSALDIAKAAEVGVARLADITTAKDAAEPAAKEAKEILAATVQAGASTEESKKRAEKLATEAAALTTSISENQQVSKQRSDEIQALLLEVQKSDSSLKDVWEHLQKSDGIARFNEERIAKFLQDLESLTKRIEGLLPGATSAGLASSFNTQKSRFKEPQNRWLWTFVGCIGGLILIAAPSFLAAIGLNVFGRPIDPTWDATWRSLTMRLPIVLPLVWLAIYAGRNYMLSLRLEEDYAYKEAISTAFEGYKREMEKITVGDSQGPAPLTTLCTNILRAIVERPGRIYEGKHQDINLMSEATAVVQTGVDLSKKKIAGS